MHLTYPVLNSLALYLDSAWKGKKITAVFTQEKEELVLEAGHSEYIRIRCGGNLGYVVPVKSFARAGSNSLDLFPSLCGRPVSSVKIVPDERILRIHADHLILEIRMFGNRSNVWLLSVQEEPEPFLYREGEGYVSLADAPQAATLPGWIKSVQNAASDFQFDLTLVNERNRFLSFCSGAVWMIQENTPLPEPGLTASGGKPIQEVLESWLYAFMSRQQFGRKKQEWLGKITRRIAYLENVRSQSQEAIHVLQQKREPEEIGHLILAHAHEISPLAETISCTDWYTGGTVEIKLKPELSAAGNAEWYYEKSRKRKLELERCQTAILQSEAGLPGLRNGLKALEQAENMRDLKEWRTRFPNFLQDDALGKTGSEERLPWRTFEVGGWQIRVGKDARSNDSLTLRGSRAGDLWLHVKDYSGSHVVIRQKSGQAFPEDIIEKAGKMAIWFSPRRFQEWVTVTVCDRKYVRKNKRMAPGAVTVERSETRLWDSPRSLGEVLGVK